MENKKKLEQLQNSLRVLAAEESDNVFNIIYRRDKVKIGFCYSRLGRYALVQGVLQYYESRNISCLKQCCYLSSRLILESSRYEGGHTFQNAQAILVAMLSDHAPTIEAFSAIHVKGCNDVSSPNFIFRLFQLALKEDLVTLRAEVAKARPAWRRRDQSEIAILNFFELFCEKDSQSMQKVVQQMHAGINSADPTMVDIIGYLPVLETKLCWIKAMPIDIQSPLVPMDIMPVAPLPAYDDVYEFLKPNWSPPPQGIVADVMRWLGYKRP